MRRRLVVLALLVLLSASAAAYHGKPGRAGVLAEGPVLLAGDVAATAQPASALYVGGGALDLALEEGRVRVVVTEVREARGPLGALLPPPEPTTEEVAGASLALRDVGARANVLVFTHGGLAQFRYDAASATLVREDRGRVAPTRDAADSGLAVAEARGAGFAHAAQTPEAALRAREGALTALGDFRLFVYDATLLVDGKAVRTGTTSDAASGERVVRYAVVELTGARLRVLDEGALVSFRAPLLDVALNGTASFAAARGSTVVDAADDRLAGDVATLEGVMTITARPTDGALRLDASGDFVAVTVGGVDRSYAPAAAAGALAVAAAVAAWAAWPTVKTVAAAALYARFAGPEVLAHEARDRTLAHVRANPGASVKDVAAAVGVSWSTAAYHLEVLAREGFLARHRAGRHRRYFAVDDASDRGAVALLHDPTARRLVDLVRESPGRTQKDLAALVGISPSTASWQLRRLVEAGVLVEERAWRKVAYRPASA